MVPMLRKDSRIGLAIGYWSRENCAIGSGRPVACLVGLLLLPGGNPSLLHRRRRRHLELRSERAQLAEWQSRSAAMVAKAGMGQEPLDRIHGRYLQDSEAAACVVGNSRSHPRMFLAPQDLRRPSNSEWSSDKPILPGQEQTLEKPGIRAASAQSVLGWVFFPYSVKYEDGSRWHPQSEASVLP